MKTALVRPGRRCVLRHRRLRAAAVRSGENGWLDHPRRRRARGSTTGNRIGEANWRFDGGLIVADKGKGGHLVTKNSYKDFQFRAEFWADHTPTA